MAKPTASIRRGRCERPARLEQRGSCGRNWGSGTAIRRTAPQSALESHRESRTTVQLSGAQLGPTERRTAAAVLPAVAGHGRRAPRAAPLAGTNHGCRTASTSADSSSAAAAPPVGTQDSITHTRMAFCGPTTSISPHRMGLGTPGGISWDPGWHPGTVETGGPSLVVCATPVPQPTPLSQAAAAGARHRSLIGVNLASNSPT